MLGSDWYNHGLCREKNPDDLFVTGAEQNVAKRVCFSCPVWRECLSEALDNRIQYGVWGGLTERDRRKLLRQHPEVTSWREMFESQEHRRKEAS
jgi:WhiB family redox-sensing transcriptional regulator